MSSPRASPRVPLLPAVQPQRGDAPSHEPGIVLEQAATGPSPSSSSSVVFSDHPDESGAAVSPGASGGSGLFFSTGAHQMNGSGPKTADAAYPHFASNAEAQSPTAASADTTTTWHHVSKSSDSNGGSTRQSDKLAAAATDSRVSDGKEESTDMSSKRSTIREGGKGDRAHDNDDNDDDEDDLVVMSREDTILQGGGYEQIGDSRNQPHAQASPATKKALMRRVGINLLLILSWYFFSTLMNVYNSWLFSRKRKSFQYPLFVTSVHMCVQFGLSSLVMCVCAKNRRIVPRQRNGKRARPTAHDWAGKVVPCALATALDIGLSNLSLKTITLTFYTMCKSSNLAFVLLFAFLFKLEKMRLSLIGIITIITIGVIMMVAAETEFVLEGAVEVLTASAMGGLRWALVQILLKHRSMGMDNPIATMFWLSPLMGAFMALGSLVIEDWYTMMTSAFFKDFGTGMQTVVLMVSPGFLVFFMNICEYGLIMRTSVMTLSVAGMVKEVLTILLSSTIFGDELTPINVTGLCIALAGIVLYNYLKWRLLLRNSAAEAEESDPGTQGRSRHGANGELDSDDEEERELIRGGGGRYTELGGGPVALSTATKTGSAPKDQQMGTRYSEADQEAAVAPAAPLSAEERERLRLREEEAELGGWSTSGTKRTGNGWDDGRADDSDS